MAERSNAAVLKTVDGQLSGGSNPSLCAIFVVRKGYKLKKAQKHMVFGLFLVVLWQF